MAKAFSEEEKEQIKIRIMETALDLFHDKGTKSLSIQELTKRVGIAQGSFYNFWKDKDALVLDVMHFRAQQKLDLLEQRFPESLSDPVGFLSEIIYVNSMDLMHKAQNRVGAVYRSFLNKLASYWKEHHAVEDVDIEGLINVFTGSFVLFSNSVQFDPEYFDLLLKGFIEDNARKFITL